MTTERPAPPTRTNASITTLGYETLLLLRAWVKDRGRAALPPAFREALERAGGQLTKGELLTACVLWAHAELKREGTP